MGIVNIPMHSHVHTRNRHSLITRRQTFLLRWHLIFKPKLFWPYYCIKTWHKQSPKDVVLNWLNFILIICTRHTAECITLNTRNDKNKPNTQNLFDVMSIILFSVGLYTLLSLCCTQRISKFFFSWLSFSKFLTTTWQRIRHSWSKCCY